MGIGKPNQCLSAPELPPTIWRHLIAPDLLDTAEWLHLAGSRLSQQAGVGQKQAISQRLSSHPLRLEVSTKLGAIHYVAEIDKTVAGTYAVRLLKK